MNEREKNIEKRKGSEAIQTKRIVLYIQFIRDFAKGIITKKMDPKQLTMMNLEIGMVGSDSVVSATNKWQKLGLEALKTGDMFPVLAQFGQVILQMRKDLNPETKLTVLELLRIFIKDIDQQPKLLQLLKDKEDKIIDPYEIKEEPSEEEKLPNL